MDEGLCKNTNAQFVDFQLSFYQPGRSTLRVKLLEHSGREYWEAKGIVSNNSAETACYGVKCSEKLACIDIEGKAQCVITDIEGEPEPYPAKSTNSGSVPSIHYAFDETGSNSYSYYCSPYYNVGDTIKACGYTSDYTILPRTVLYPLYRDTVKTINVSSSAKLIEEVFFSMYFQHPNLNNINVILNR